MKKTGYRCRTFKQIPPMNAIGERRRERRVLDALSTYNSYHVLSTLQTFSTRKKFLFSISAMCTAPERERLPSGRNAYHERDAYRVCFSIKSLVVRSQRKRATCNSHCVEGESKNVGLRSFVECSGDALKSFGEMEGRWFEEMVKAGRFMC